MTTSASKMPTTARKEAAMVIAMMVLLAVWQGISSYRTAVRHAEELVSALAKSLDYQVDSSFRSIDALLAEASDRIDPQRWPQDAELQKWFRIRLGDFPEIRYMAVVGKDGMSVGPALTSTGLAGGAAAVSAVGLEHYQFHLDHPDDRSMHIGNPIMGRRDGLPLVPLTRGFPAQDGKFAGYVMVGLDPHYLLGMLNNILIEEAGAAGIMRSDGVFLARAPWQDEAFGKSVAKAEFFSKFVSRRKVGVAHYLAVQDGHRKIAGFRTLDRYPVAVFIGLTTQTAFAAWREELYYLLGVIAVCSIALLRGATLLDRREHTRVQLAQKTTELQELSIRDDLTGLLNQRAFYEALRQELASAEERGRPLVLVYFDLNDFKQLNDRQGHTVGDELLVEVAAAMRQSMREADHCCRYGGDEFAIIMPNTIASQALNACRRLIAAFDAESRHGVTFSIGIAESGPGQAATVNDFVRRADALMYEAKDRSKRSPGHHVVTQGPAQPARESATAAPARGGPSVGEALPAEAGSADAAG